jgi:hypothetical protein
MTGEWVPLDGSWTPAKIHPGPLPERVFRYRALDLNALDRFDFEVLEERVFLAGAGGQNDKDEGRLRLVMHGSGREIRRQWLKLINKHMPNLNGQERAALAKQNAEVIAEAGGLVSGFVVESYKDILNDLLRMACFTTRPTNERMWKEYGKLRRNDEQYESAGICIEYQTDETWKKVGLARVEYSEIRPRVNLMLADAELQKEMAAALFVKSEDWKYECEWRIIAFIQSKRPYPDNLTENSKIGFPGCIRSLTFGPETPSDVIQGITERIKTSGRDIPLRQAVKDGASGLLGIVTLPLDGNGDSSTSSKSGA